MTSETEAKSRGVAGLPAGAEKLQLLGKTLLQFLTFIIPILVKSGRKARELYKKLPDNAANFFFGFVFCFFGGLYPITFAAIQAAEYGGRKTVLESLEALGDEAIKIIEESKKDDEVDANKDGIADVDQISDHEFVERKTLLVLRKMNPEKVDTALSGIYKVWLSVASVLTIRFAMAVSLALAIADFMKQPVNRFVAPTIEIVIPDQYDKWVPVVLGWICKSIGMSIAFYIQAVRSAFASAAIGGKMMAHSAYEALQARNITLGGLIKDDHSDTYVDEMLTYAFAALGFFFQFGLGFDVPFPFNILLWPFELLEWYIRWSITKVSGEN